MLKIFSRHLGILMLIVLMHNIYGQLSVGSIQNTTGVENAVNSLLSANGGVQVSNISYSGYGLVSGNTGSSIGGFSGNFLGMTSGLVLSTGKVSDLPGANFLDHPGTNFGTAGHALANLVMGSASKDAAVLEFDVKVTGSTFKFDYVFASEEYPEKSCNINSDRFGVFIKQVGQSQYTRMNPHISMRTTHGGAGAFSTDNPCVAETQYYINNPVAANSTSVISFDGYTSLITTQANVEPCKTYHVVIVIADGETGFVDSGLLISAGSMSTTPLSISHEGSLEFCKGGSVVLNAPPGYTYKWKKNNAYISGATGASYAATGSGAYSVELTNSCGIVYTTSPVTVNEKALPSPYLLSVSNNLCTAPNGEIVLTARESGATYLWNTGATDRSITVDEPGSYSVEVTKNGCESVADTNIIGNTMVVTSTIVHEDCKGQRKGSITPHVEGKNGPFTYTWTGTSTYLANEYPNGYKSTLSWLCCLYAGDYTLTIRDEHQCEQTHTYTVTEPAFVDVVPVVGRCSANAAPTGGTAPYTITWYKGNTIIGTGTSIDGLVAAGDYKVKVTDSKNCGIPDTYKYFSVAPPTPENVQRNLSVTRGGATVSPTGGTEPYVVKWYKGNVQIGTGLSISNLIAGTDYKVSVTDQGCQIPSNFEEFNITNGCALTISSTENVPSCPNSQTAYIEINVGGTEPDNDLSYLWTGPEGFEPITDQNLMNVYPGAYTVQVEDETGCKVSKSFDLKPVLFTVEGTVVNATCIGKNDGAISTTVAGPYEGQYSVSWSSPDFTFSSNSKNISGLAPGRYVIRVDKHQCFITKEFVVVAPAQEIQTQVAYCYQQVSGNVFVTAAGGQAPYTYDWRLNNQTVSNANPATSLGGGNYQLITADNRGCKRTEEVVVNPILNVSVNEGSTKGHADLLISGGLEQYSITWSQGATTSHVSGLLDNKLYSYTVTDQQGCVVNGSINIQTGCDIHVVGDITAVNCYGQSNGGIELDIDNCTSCNISWTGPTGSAGTSEDLDGIPAGAYTAIISDVNGCSAVYEGLVSQPYELTAQAIKKDISCHALDNGEIQIVASGGTPVASNVYNTAWKRNGNNFATNVLLKTGLEDGDYQITITDAKGCSTVVNSTIAEPAALNLLLSEQHETCFEAKNGSVSVTTLTGGTLPYSYTWTGPATFISSTRDIGNLAPGNYTLDVKDANGCTISSSKNVLGSASMLAVTIDSYSNVVCSGSSSGAISVSASGGTASYQYQWYRYGVLMPELTGDSYTNLKEGNYEIVVLDANNCSVSVSQSITQDALVEITTPDDVLCEGEQVTLTPSKTGESYKWFADGSSTVYSTSSPYVFSPALTGDYVVEVTFAGGCIERSAPRKITVNSGPVLDVTASPSTHFCEGSSVNLSTQYYAGGVYYWKRGEDVLAEQSNVLQGAGTAGEYFVSVDVGGCVSASDSIIITKHDLFSIDAVLTDAGCPGSANGTATIAATGAFGTVTYDWAHLEGANNGAEAQGLNPGDYLVVATDQAGCTVSREVLIKGVNVLVAASQVKPLCNTNTKDEANPISHLGSISLNTMFYSTVGEVCYTGTPSPSVACGTGTVLTGSQSVTIASGQTYYIPAGNTATGQLLFNGGTLVVCGTYNGPTSSYYGSGKIVIHNGGWFNIQGYFGIDRMDFENYGTLSVEYLGTLTTGSIKNYGVINTNNLSSYNPSKPVVNYGVINASQKVIIDNNSTLNNYCTINTVIVDHLSGTVNNNGTIRLTDIYNFNGTLNLSDLSLIKTSVMEGKGTITGPSTGMASITACGWTTIIPINSTVASAITGNVTVGLTAAPCNVNENYQLTMNSCTVEWSNGQSGNTISGIQAGTYSATLTCGSCTKQVYYTLDQPTPVELTMEKTNVACFGQSTGSATVYATGGTPGMANPYTYSWEKGSVLLAGEEGTLVDEQPAEVYTVNVRDANSCLASSSVSITEPEQLVVVIQCPSHISCRDNDNGVLSTNIHGGVGPFTYVWKRDGILLSNNNNGEPHNLSPGEYEVIVTDANGCVATATYTLENPENSCGGDGETPCFKVTVSKTDACPEMTNGTAHVVVTGGVGPFKFDWAHIPGDNNPAFLMGLSANTYSVVIKDMGSVGTEKCYSNKTVLVGTKICPDLPKPCSLQVNSQVQPETCPNQSNGAINLTITGTQEGAGLKIDWAHIDGTNNSEDLTGLTAKTYQVTVWEESKPHCIRIIKDIVVPAPGPLTIYTSAGKICTGEKAILTSSFPTGNVWTGPGITVPLTTRSIEVEQAGEYHVNVDGACPQSAVTTIVVDEHCVEKPFCTPVVITEMIAESPCVRDELTMKLVTAKDEYDTYIKDKKAQFREQYREHCMKNAHESLTMEYTQREHHYTLYYYDQAGNLVRTVPPAGVEQITGSATLNQINEDRRNGIRTEFTNHALPSTYTYNSLNQLITQSIPDHDQVNLKKVSDLSQGIGNAAITASAFNGMSGVAIGNDGNDGLIYLSSNGGTSWTPLSTVTTENLNDVIYANNTAYVVGDKGTFLMYDYSVPSSSQRWIVKETDIAGDLVGIGIVPASGNRVAITRTGKIYTSANDNEWTLQATSGLESAINSSGGTLLDIKHSGSDWYAVVGTSSASHVVSSSDGITWSVGSSFVSTLAVKELHPVKGGNGLSAIAGNATVNIWLQSTDGGTNWTTKPVRNADIIGNSIKKTLSLNMNTSVTLTDNGKLVFTNDNETWTTVTDYLLNGTGPVAMPSIIDICSGGSVIYALGTTNDVYKSINGGFSWVKLTNSNSLPAGYNLVSFGEMPNDPLEFGGIATNGTSIHLAMFSVLETQGSVSFYTETATAINTSVTDIAKSSYFYDQTGYVRAYLRNSTGGLYSISYSVPATAYVLSSSLAIGLKDYHFSDLNNGYYLAPGLLKTTADAGANWSDVWTVTIPSSAQCLAVSPSATNFVIGATDGKFHRVQSSGITEGNVNKGVLKQASGSGSAAFVSDNNGVLYSTANHGNSWTLSAALPKLAVQYDLAYSGGKLVLAGKDSQRGFIVYSSSDDGATWSAPSTNLPNLTNPVANILIDGNDTWVATENNSVYKVNSSYTKMSASGANILNGITIAQGGIIAVGSSGIILKQDGNNLVNDTKVKTKKMNALDMINGGQGFAVGEHGVVLKITNSGTSFFEMESKTTKELMAVDFADLNNGLAAGLSGTIRYTTDGGATWKTAYDNSSQLPSGITFYGVYQVNNNKAIAVGEQGGTGVVYYTNNFGNTAGAEWDKQILLNGSSATSVPDALYAIHFVDAGNGLTGGVSGSSGTIYTVNFSGNVPSFTARTDAQLANKTVRTVRMADRKIMYAAGDASLLLVSRDGGLTDSWEVFGAAGPVSGNLTNISFREDNSSLLISGDNNSLYGALDARFTDRFWYDELGRLIASQNAKQSNFPSPGFSYTLYDELGRIVEVGEAIHTITPDEHPGAVRNNLRSQLYEAEFLEWLGDASSRREVTRTYYDEPMNNGPSIPDFVQEELRGRVAAITYNRDGQGEYDHATHYSYDVHGNVDVLIQDYAGLEQSLQANANTYAIAGEQRFKRLEYRYDLLSGNVHEVRYQHKQQDQMYHRYEYDADNRLTHVYTSTNGELWDRDARYNYYRHGPLARTETGELQVAGTDYFYTLQGWIKGVNANTLYTNRDAGHDGNMNNTGVPGSMNGGTSDNLHRQFAGDGFGYSLGYFAGDYSAIGSNSALLSKDGAMNGQISNLYNGNISHMVTAIDKKGDISNSTQLTAYKYDQLNRIKELKSYSEINIGTNAVTHTGSSAPNYHETFSYDANGNILSLTRTGLPETGTQPLPMDAFDYKYDYISPGKLRSNRLYHVNDNPAYSGNFGDDIDNQVVNGNAYSASDKNTWNYEYDEIGNLIKDNSEEIEKITWNVYGKVDSVSRFAGSQKKDLEFYYDASGNRIAKISKPNATRLDPATWTITWYVRDATGNIMSTYEQEGTLTLKEQEIYGSSRLGMVERNVTIVPSTPLAEHEPRKFTSLRGYRRYEGSNHLGNVLVTISDRKLASASNGVITSYRPEVLSYQDYYAFGSSMHGRSLSGGEYDYGFNGNRKDEENSSDSYDFGARLYDARLGRFLSVDRYSYMYPDQTTYGFSFESPIMFNDYDGNRPRVTITTSADGKNIKIEVVTDVYLVRKGRKAKQDGSFVPNMKMLKNYLKDRQIMVGDKKFEVEFKFNVTEFKSHRRAAKEYKTKGYGVVMDYNSNYEGRSFHNGPDRNPQLKYDYIRISGIEKYRTPRVVGHELGHDLGYADKYIDITEDGYSLGSFVIEGFDNTLMGTMSELSEYEAMLLVDDLLNSHPPQPGSSFTVVDRPVSYKKDEIPPNLKVGIIDWDFKTNTITGPTREAKTDSELSGTATGTTTERSYPASGSDNPRGPVNGEW